MHNLKKYLQEARKNNVAIGHFGFGTMAMLHGIMDAARELSDEIDHPFKGGKIPIILGVSEGDRKVFGTLEAVTLTQLYREIYDYPVFIDADHTHDVDAVQQAIEMGYDMVIYDGVDLSIEQNIQNTQRVVKFKNEVNPRCVVEGELGYIASGSDMKDELPEGITPENMTTPEEAKFFVDKTGIDALAPAVGNVHGIIATGNPRLDIERIKDISEKTKVDLVLHGGSGISPEDFVAAIHAGMNVVHVATALRKAHRDAIAQAYSENPSVSPTKSVPQAREAVKNVVKEHIRLFLGNSSTT